MSEADAPPLGAATAPPPAAGAASTAAPLSPVPPTPPDGGGPPPEDPRDAALRRALPACQPQEGSIGSRVCAFTPSELEELRAALPAVEPLRPRDESHTVAATVGNGLLDIRQPWGSPLEASASNGTVPEENLDAALDNDSGIEGGIPHNEEELDYFGAPRLAARDARGPRQLRRLCREGIFAGPTNGQCPGFLQCNLVVLPRSPVAFDFLLFCQRNPKACPLIEVCDGGSPHPVGVALDADLRTDLPRYAIYRDGQLEREATDVLDCWPADAVAFLIGCSFSCDGALREAGIPLRSAEHGRNVPMYRTHLQCRPAGSLRGNLVVSMKPVPALQVARAAEVTSRFPHAHGGPVAVGHGDALGIRDLGEPDWGDPVPLGPGEVPVFHACGVTPQAVIQASRVPFAITHAAGHMFVTDLPADMRHL